MEVGEGNRSDDFVEDEAKSKMPDRVAIAYDGPFHLRAPPKCCVLHR